MSLAHAISLAFPISARDDQPATQPRHLRVVHDAARAEAAPTAAELYRHYGPLVYRRCRRLLKSEEAAADATQEVFLRLIRNGELISSRHDMLPWLYRVASNYCLNVLRDARGRGEEALDEVSELPTRTTTLLAPDARLARQVLAQFDEATQAIAVGILVEGREAEELARALGVSRRTISRKLERFVTEARRFVEAGSPA